MDGWIGMDGTAPSVRKVRFNSLRELFDSRESSSKCPKRAIYVYLMSRGLFTSALSYCGVANGVFPGCLLVRSAAYSLLVGGSLVAAAVALVALVALVDVAVVVDVVVAVPVDVVVAPHQQG
ncbi:hypothetical protein B0O80DRAFT_89819 [Mortierella sp. GBAus27b]|nr:hypothetical protein B0O80DRAFT_89819 [Mortierella sp. GBAus27b]